MTQMRTPTGAGHRYFTIMAVMALIVAAIGFGPTYYLRSRPPALPLTPLVEVHGAVFTVWLMLHLAQTLLVARSRVGWHRRLGVAAAGWAVLLVVVGFATAVAAARRGHNPAQFSNAAAFLAVPVVDLIVFVGLVLPALIWRRHKEAHKRLMLLATLSLLGAAFTRFPFLGPGGAAGLIPYCLMAVSLPIFDRVSIGRIARASWWGTAWVILTVPVRPLVAESSMWHRIAERMIG
jgi:hypothetical protein